MSLTSLPGLAGPVVLGALIAAAAAPSVGAPGAALLSVQKDESELPVALRRVAPVGDEVAASMIEVELRNKASDAIEPLRFRVIPAGEGAEHVLVERVPPPNAKRGGRAVAPRKRESYLLAVPLGPEALEGARVEVAEYCSWDPKSDGGRLDLGSRCVKLGRPDVREEGDGAWSVVTLENRTAHALDVVMRATYRNDGGGRCLIGATLEPGETRELEIRAIPATPFGGEVLFPRADVSRVELIDWCARLDPGSGPANALLSEAWDGWWSVPADRLPLSVRFVTEVDHRGLFSGDGKRFDLVERVTGTAWVLSDGSVRTEGEDGLPMTAGASGVADRAVREALGWIARRPFDEMALGWEARVIEEGDPAILVLSGAGEAFGRSVADLRIEDGAITGTSYRGGLGERAEEWEVTRRRAGWRLDRVEQDLGTQGLRVRSGKYDEVDGVEVLTSWESLDENALTKSPRWARLSFEGWSFGVEPPPALPLPGGELAEQLRAAWDGFYRYPEKRVELLGSYAVNIRGGDGVWMGRNNVNGNFSLRHFHNGYWRHRTVTTDDPKADASTREILVNAVEDRIGMWSGRTPCWRDRFDETFVGAVLVPGESKGWIRVEGHRRIGGVQVKGDRVQAIRTLGGVITTFRWKRQKDGVLLPVRVERRGNGRVELEWEEVAPGWWFPERAHFTEIFGRDWGPETIDMEIRRVEPL